MRFKLLRYFSIASAVAVVVATAILAVFYDRYATDNLVTSVERQNVILASFIANDLTARFPQHFKARIHIAEDLAKVHHVQHIKNIDAILKDLLKSLPVLKVKVYRGDLTIYSTEHRQIGKIKSSPGFLIALNQGIPASKLTFRGEFNAFEGVISNRNIVETYVPVGGLDTMIGKSGRLIIEIYTDVTPLVAEIEQSKVNLIAGLIFLFAALYGVLILIVRRADRVIDRQYEDLNGEIAERKKAEKSMQESEARFRDLIESASVIAWEVELESFLFTYVSPHAVDLLGYRLDEWYAEGFWAEHIHPDDREQTVSFCMDATERGEDHDFEYRMIAANGRTVWLRDIVTVVKEGGRPVALRGFMIDISERKKAEEARERLSQAVETVPVGIVLFDSDDRLVFFNSRYAELMEIMADILKPGVTFEELIRTIVDRQPVKAAQGREEEFIRERIKHHRNPTGPFEIRRQDKWLIADETCLPDGSIFTIFTDITEQKQAEEDRRKALADAEQANQAKSEFLAAMSHDLRTPLNAILGFADILSGQYFGPISEKYQEYAQDIHSSGEHLLELVNEILDLSTIEAGKQSVVKEKLSALEIVAECMRIVEDKARSNGINLVTKVAKGLPPLYADRRASKQILLNLLSNAVKFTPQGGKITVSAKASKRSTTLKIADTGKGIPAEKLPNLTDPFTKAGLDPYIAEEGWGLGLTITQALIDLHDGKLDIKSKVGKGTTVTVTFPNGAP